MADGESKGLTSKDVASIGERAFLAASWLARDEQADEDLSQSPEERFRECLAQAFEALLCCRSDRDGCGFMAAGYGDWVERLLAEVPSGWRPAYDTGRRVPS